MQSSTNQVSLFRIILVGLIGNVVEWYDFAVYGYFATVIGSQFFPSGDPDVSLIASFGAFAAGFLVRPLGGLVFGRIGDLFGRQRAMLLSVIAMAVPTVLMGFLPTYQQVGILAPIMIVLLRIVQGLSVGGEFTSSLIFLVEQAPAHRRAFSAVWGAWGASAGILLGSFVGFLVTRCLDEPQLVGWGWRLPFVFGGVVAGLGLWIRTHVHADSPPTKSKSPVREVFTQHLVPVLRVALLNVGNGVAFYTMFIYAVTYMKTVDHLPEGVALRLNTIAMGVLLLIMPLSAWLSDRLGRRLIVGTAFFALVAGSIPLFHLLHSGDETSILAAELLFAGIIGILSGGMPVLNVELVPSPVRCTGLALAYNAAVGIFGGLTPIIVTWLIEVTDDPIAPAYWLVAASAISGATILFSVRETRHLPLHRN